MRVSIRVRNEAALDTIMAMLERQYGKPATTTDALHFALHQTALQIDKNYQKPPQETTR